MKKTLSMILLTALATTLTGCSVGGGIGWGVLLVLGLLILPLAVVRSRALAKMRRSSRMSQKQRAWLRKQIRLTNILYLISVLLVVLGLLLMLLGGCEKQPNHPTNQNTPPEVTTEPATQEPGFQPQAAASANPDNWNIQWEIFQNTTPVSSYNRTEPISFGDPADYFALPGIATFRGNNYRNSASYGTATVEQEKLSIAWTVETKALAGGR